MGPQSVRAQGISRRLRTTKRVHPNPRSKPVPILSFNHLVSDRSNPKTDLQTSKKQSNDLRKELRLSQHALQAADRLKLELEGVQTENTNLQAQIIELQRANTELKKQNEKWKKFEGRNDADAKARIELEVVKGELEERVKELESREKDAGKEIKKLKALIKSLEVGIKIRCVSLPLTFDSLGYSRGDGEGTEGHAGRTGRGYGCF